MLIFRIHQDLNNGYDTYDSAVVVACDEEHARSIHPMGQQIVWDPELEAWVDEDGSNADWSASSWAADPKLVEVQEFGFVTGGSAKPGDVLVASYNAG